MSQKSLRQRVQTMLTVDETVDQVNHSLDGFNAALADFNRILERCDATLQDFARVTRKVDAIANDMAGVVRQLDGVVSRVELIAGPALRLPDQFFGRLRFQGRRVLDEPLESD